MFYLNVFVYNNECIDVNTALKNSFKSMSCSGRKHQLPRNFLTWQAPGCILVYSLKSMGMTQIGSFLCFVTSPKVAKASTVTYCCLWRYHQQMSPMYIRLSASKSFSHCEPLLPLSYINIVDPWPCTKMLE